MDKTLKRAVDVLKLMSEMLDTQIQHSENMKKSYEQQIKLAKLNKEHQTENIEQIEKQIKLLNDD